MKTLERMTAEQRAALLAFADKQGRRWRADLREMWERGWWQHLTDPAIVPFLQQIRNTLGPSGLAAITLPALRQAVDADIRQRVARERQQGMIEHLCRRRP